MKKCISVSLFACVIAVLSLFLVQEQLPAQEQVQEKAPEIPKINWIYGPKKADIGDIAEIQVPKGYNFADGADTRKIMKLFGNIPSFREEGYIAPVSNKWFIVFEFEDVGFIKDDEKDSLDADAMMKSMKEGDEPSNEIRRQQGLAEMHMVGWHKEPFYNKKTNNLEWATIIESQGFRSINHNIRYLGRNGVMKAVVVSDPKDFDTAVQESAALLDRYNFKEGNSYAEYQEGDKLAEYGLTALVTGGAVAVAAKAGLLQKFWKFILIGLAAIGTFFKKMYNSIRGKNTNPSVLANREDLNSDTNRDTDSENG
ncbi:MAG: DUF2167 domain-containing protein [bacterium]|nr:DUF2167 domain-containing protein [bacterium]